MVWHLCPHLAAQAVALAHVKDHATILAMEVKDPVAVPSRNECGLGGAVLPILVISKLYCYV